jgi:hypothetical protein
MIVAGDVGGIKMRERGDVAEGQRPGHAGRKAEEEQEKQATLIRRDVAKKERTRSARGVT